MTSREASAVAPKTKTTPAVNPKATKAVPGGRCFHLGVFDCNAFNGVIPALSLTFCATGRDCGQLLDSQISMKTAGTLNRLRLGSVVVNLVSALSESSVNGLKNDL